MKRFHFILMAALGILFFSCGDDHKPSKKENANTNQENNEAGVQSGSQQAG